MPGSDPSLFSTKLTSARNFRLSVRPDWTKPCRSKKEGQDYIQSLNLGIRSPSLIATYAHINELRSLDELPNQYVLKPVAGNGNRGVFAVRNGFCHMSGEKITLEMIKNAFLQETSITKQTVIVEEFLECAVRPEGLPRDYKFYNFGKECAFVHIIERNSRKDQSKNKHFFLREDLTPFPFQVQRTQKHSNDPIVLPDCFGEMLEKAKRVSHSLMAFSRVDLYADSGGPVFGEITLYPHGGKGYLPDADRYLGKKWRGIDGASHLDRIRYLPYIGKKAESILRRMHFNAA